MAAMSGSAWSNSRRSRRRWILASRPWKVLGATVVGGDGSWAGRPSSTARAGASALRSFLRSTLPFLAPALISAGVISFMASLENYNTTMFAKGGACTFATEIGAMARNPNGHPPGINEVGAVIILLTVSFALGHALLKRREAAKGP